MISHDFSQSGTNFTAYHKIQTWYAQQLVLDNSILLWATEIGEATQHDLTTMPYVLAGNAGSKIRRVAFSTMVTTGTTTTNCSSRSRTP